MKKSKIFFYNEKSQKISGNFYYSKNTNNNQKKPTVILVQGLSGSKDNVFPEAAQIFTQNGYNALAFDYRGFGESEGERQRLFPSERIEDARHAIAWARQQEEVDENRIYLYGLSYGAPMVLCIAALEKGIKAVSSVSAVSVCAVSGARFVYTSCPGFSLFRKKTRNNTK